MDQPELHWEFVPKSKTSKTATDTHMTQHGTIAAVDVLQFSLIFMEAVGTAHGPASMTATTWFQDTRLHAHADYSQLFWFKCHHQH